MLEKATKRRLIRKIPIAQMPKFKGFGILVSHYVDYTTR